MVKRDSLFWAKLHSTMGSQTQNGPVTNFEPLGGRSGTVKDTLMWQNFWKQSKQANNIMPKDLCNLIYRVIHLKKK